MLAIQICNQSVRHRLDVVLALAQRGQVNVKHVEAVEEIFAQVAALHGFLRNFIGSRHHAHIDFEFGASTQPADLGILENAQ